MAEMERFELSRRFEPTYRISSADPSTAWVHLRIFSPVFNSQNLLERKAGEKAKKYSIWNFENPELAGVFEGTKFTDPAEIFEVSPVMTTSIRLRIYLNISTSENGEN